MNTVSASGEVLKVYQTGDRPILILCSDGYHYICKYKEPGYSSYKLVNELIGGIFAKTWGIATPVMSLVLNDPIIWDDSGLSHDPIAPLLGSRKMENVSDLGEYNCDQVWVSEWSLFQLLQIALFDMWLANEDRTSNNYNLLYDLKQGRIVSIDYGGLFNSETLNYPVCQLTPEDSIISSDLFFRLKDSNLQDVVQRLHIYFLKSVAKCRAILQESLDFLPDKWKADRTLIEAKLAEVFAIKWVTDTWDNFKVLTKGV